MEPVFRSSRDASGAELFAPTDAAVGPWNPEHLHGGPTCGLIARAAERLVADAAMHPARLTVDLFRAVPRKPLHARAVFAREGKRIKSVQVSLLDGETEVARGSALFMRRQEMPEVPPFPGPLPSPPPGPEGIETTTLWRGEVSSDPAPGYHMRVQTRWASEPDVPQAIWFRQPMSLVDDEPLTPFQRVAALGDFANAVASFSIRRADGSRAAAFMNTDSTLYMARLPQGEWIGMAADHSLARDGVDVAEVVHYDADGRYGRSVQARMLMARGPGARR